MSDESKGQTDKRDTITPDEHRNIWIWAIMLVALFIAIGVVTTGDVYKDELATNQRHDDWMNPDVGEGGTKPPPVALPAGANPLRVDGGIYLDRIPDLSEQTSSWSLAAGTEQVVSQLRMGVLVLEQDWGFYFKMFAAMFAAVGVALTTFFLDPTYGSRFGIGVGALFAAVANTYVNSQLVPHTGVITLTDMVNLVGIMTIGLSILQSTISVILYDTKGKEALSRLFDRVSFAIFLVAYVLINLALPWAATL
jgi:hypothetical protein